MKRSWMMCALAMASVGTPIFLYACGDDTLYAPAADAGPFDAAGLEGGPPPPPSGDSGGPSTCGDSTGAPPRLLVSLNHAASSELVAFNLATKTVDGRFTYASKLGTTYSFGTNPFLLEQSSDLVVKLDAKEPWKPLTAADVSEDKDAGFTEPLAVAVPSCAKGYVVRGNRNSIAVVDTNAGNLDAASSIVSHIDLATQLQSDDHDMHVEPISAVWVPSKGRIYVLLGNVDFTKIETNGFRALCANTKPSIVAIDPTTDQIVSLGGAGPQGALLLEGYSPVFGTPLFYDAALDRLVVLEAGCNLDDGDGGAGAIARRRVEAVSLGAAGGQVTTLLDLNGGDFPNSLLFVDGSRAVLSVVDQITFAPKAYFWNPASTALGAQLPVGFSFAAYDGKGSAVGPYTTTIDGGPGFAIASVPFTDAGAVDAASVQVLGENPFTDNASGFLGGAEVWPHP
ncbi:MAG TPA: hypothetical protein VIF62_15765 [Labilithrix sp.]